MSFIKDLLTKGKPESTMRFILVFTVVFVILDVFGVWTYVSLCKQVLQPIDATVVSLVSALIAIIVTGKWLEKKEEVKNDSNNNKTNKEP